MDHLLNAVQGDLLDPRTLTGALVWAIVFLVIAAVAAASVRRLTRRMEAHLSDVTGLRFFGAFAQAIAYLIAFILYAHLIPELHALGTTLVAGVGVVSVVIGLAAQNTLGNLVAGFALVLYKPIRVGDRVQLTIPKGLTSATVETVSLGYTVLREDDKDEIIVPNSVMGSSVVIRTGPGKATPGSTG